MQLTYHGQPYQASFPAIDAVRTGEHGIFLGRPYALKRFKITSPSPARTDLPTGTDARTDLPTGTDARTDLPTGTELTYRGIRYSL